MTPLPNPQPTSFPEAEELRALLGKLCEERIRPEEIARLEEIVLNRPEAGAYYVQFMGMYADPRTLSPVSAEVRGRGSSPTSAKPRRRSTRRSRREAGPRHGRGWWAASDVCFARDRCRGDPGGRRGVVVGGTPARCRFSPDAVREQEPARLVLDAEDLFDNTVALRPQRTPRPE